MSRIQWNFFGRELKFSGSDLDFSDKPIGLIALAAVTNRSRYTRFSQSGGGQLEGFEEGEPGRYRVNQFVVESAFKYAGFSWQQEFHWKEINDLKNSTLSHLAGNLLQFGYFFNRLVQWIPEELEFAFRHAAHFPDRSQSDIQLHEFAFNLNWYFAGHANKVTAEATYFNYKNYEFQRGKDWRFRLQWDISI
jgi:hypothetical protein